MKKIIVLFVLATLTVSCGSLFELLEFSSLPSAEEGAFAYSNNDFWLGVGP